MRHVLAMVLAGGRGKRMDVLCQVRPKPTLPFAGESRVIDFTLSNCIHSDIENIGVLTDYQRSVMGIYLQRWVAAHAGPRNITVLEPRKTSYCGTADAVFQNLDFVEDNTADVVLVLAGDHVYKMDYRDMIHFHQQTHADVTVGVITIPIDEAHRFGIVTTNSENRITDFVEKPTRPTSNLVSMGIYVFNKETLIRHLIEDAAQLQSPHDFGHAILPRMVKRDHVYAYRFNGYWRDIGTPASYYEANMELLSHKPALSMDGAWQVLTEPNNYDAPKKFQQGIAINSLVSPGCIIKGRVENSILSPGVWVEEKAVVTNSIVMNNSFIGYHSVVDHSIMDEDVNIGKFCYIGFGKYLNSGSSDITVLGKEVKVPSHTAVCGGCRVLPYVDHNDFQSQVVVEDSIVEHRIESQPLRKLIEKQAVSILK